jgi:hypothetical protein
MLMREIRHQAFKLAHETAAGVALVSWKPMQ